MKKNYYLLLTAFALLFSFSNNAQNVDEIIGNYIENTGGAEKWKNVEGYIEFLHSCGVSQDVVLEIMDPHM